MIINEGMNKYTAEEKALSWGYAAIQILNGQNRNLNLDSKGYTIYFTY